MATVDPLHKWKKTLKVFRQTDESPLSSSELLTYCYLVYQHSFNTVPSFNQTAKNTGIKAETVSKAVATLQGYGLLTADRRVVDELVKPDWFVVNTTLRQGQPNESVFKWLEFWRTLVRQPGEGNPLPPAAVLVYSYIRHCAYNKFTPRHGWSYEYVAAACRTEPITVKRSLATLKQHGFLEFGSRLEFGLYELDDWQLDCFSDAKAAREIISTPVKLLGRKSDVKGFSFRPDHIPDIYELREREAQASHVVEPQDFLEEVSPAKAEGQSPKEQALEQLKKVVLGYVDILGKDEAVEIFSQVKKTEAWWKSDWRSEAKRLFLVKKARRLTQPTI